MGKEERGTDSKESKERNRAAGTPVTPHVSPPSLPIHKTKSSTYISRTGGRWLSVVGSIQSGDVGRGGDVRKVRQRERGCVCDELGRL